jgi:Tol biopolymer transport system component
MDPAWSPDGTRIAYVRALRPGGRPDVFVMNVDGKGGSRLTSTPLAEREPAWSPDATRIAFIARVSAAGPFHLFVMNADGTDPTRISAPPNGDDLSPAWSPDGTRIAFASTRAGGFPDIYTVAPDGGGLQRLTNDDLIDGSPTWSPDGTRIAFERCQGGNPTP